MSSRLSLPILVSFFYYCILPKKVKTSYQTVICLAAFYLKKQFCDTILEHDTKSLMRKPTNWKPSSIYCIMMFGWTQGSMQLKYKTSYLLGYTILVFNWHQLCIFDMLGDLYNIRLGYAYVMIFFLLCRFCKFNKPQRANQWNAKTGCRKIESLKKQQG